MRLELLSEAHLEGLAEIAADPDVQRFTLVPSPPPASFPRQWLEAYEKGRRDGTREGFAVLDEAGEFVGIAVAFRIEPEARTVELGYIVAPRARGRGIASAALELLTAWAFSELGALRIELRIAVDNEPSIRVAERCGYVREGVLRSVHLKHGVRQDVSIWSRLPSDPEP